MEEASHIQTPGELKSEGVPQRCPHLPLRCSAFPANWLRGREGRGVFLEFLLIVSSANGLLVGRFLAATASLADEVDGSIGLRAGVWRVCDARLCGQGGSTP